MRAASNATRRSPAATDTNVSGSVGRTLTSCVAMARDANSPMKGELLQGTLDLLVLQVEHGSLYPALHRLEDRGWISSFWGTSENNRRARYYRLTRGQPDPPSR